MPSDKYYDIYTPPEYVVITKLIQHKISKNDKKKIKPKNSNHKFLNKNYPIYRKSLYTS